MEIDILNDILNKTISSLFTNKAKHNSYLSLDEEEYIISDYRQAKNILIQDKEIEQSKQIQIQQHKQQQSKQQPQQQSQLHLQAQNKQPLQQLQLQQQQQQQQEQQQIKQPQQVQQQIKQQPKQKQETLSQQEQWKLTVGKKKLEESMKRLNLDEKKISSKTYLNQPLDFLIQEKQAIKNELKRFDQDFFEVFKHIPNRAEKEIMKPVYIYYKTLKNAINSKANNSSANASALGSGIASDNSLTQIGITFDNQSQLSGTSHQTNPIVNTNTNVNNNANMNNGNASKYGHSSTYSQNYISMNNTVVNPVNPISKTVNQPNDKVISGNTISYKNINHKKANSASATVSSKEEELLDSKPQVVAKKPLEKIRALSKEEVISLEKEYYSIKKEQYELKQKLHQYQTEFQNNNNRKVKFVKDITPVKVEYDQYKKIKNRMKDIKDAINENNEKK